jgi:acetolactate synthase-1/2/3 large subunit
MAVSRALHPTPSTRRAPAKGEDSGIHELVPSAHRSASHSLVRALLAEGVDTYFGVPGGPISPVCQAILDLDGVRFIESRHETSAAFAAASYARATGRVPGVVVTAGPGATNAVTGVANADLGRTPMVVLCGDVPWAAEGRRLEQNTGPEGIDIERMLGHLVRASVRVARAESAPTQALAALDAARGPQPGPSLIVVPMDRGRARTRPSPMVQRSTIERLERVPHAAVKTAAKWLQHADRPLIVLGAGCRGHEHHIRRLVDALNVPFVTTPQAKGIVSERHPRSLRNGGMAASIWARRYTAEPVDAALVLGTDLDDSAVGPTPYVGPKGRLVHVDLDATVFHRNREATLPVIADVGTMARALADHVMREGIVHRDTRRLMRAARAASPFDEPEAPSDDRRPIAPHRAILDLEAAAGEDARFITDIGGHMLFALHYLTAGDPDRFHIHLRLGSMGSGIAGAVGLGLADRERPVVCICGDGGMQMNGMELLVAADLGLPITYAVFNDARYNLVHHGMRQLYGRGGSDWETPFVDFAGWASAMGVPAARITHPGQITARLLQRLRRIGPGPSILDIRIDREAQLRGGGRVEALQRMSVPEPS